VGELSNEEVKAAVLKLDAKLVALAEAVTDSMAWPVMATSLATRVIHRWEVALILVCPRYCARRRSE
jgi:hypothetical protein